MSFGSFYRQWAEKIAITSSPSVIKSAYFVDEIDHAGFATVSEFFMDHLQDWSRTMTRTLETRSALAARLDAREIAKFRLINDRHMINLAQAEFLDQYHASLDERTLFLIHNRIPPMRVCAALTAAKTATFALALNRLPSEVIAKDPMLFNAIASLFQIELHNTLRGYIYFERQNTDQDVQFIVSEAGDDQLAADYYEPEENRQLTFEQRPSVNSLELF